MVNSLGEGVTGTNDGDAADSLEIVEAAGRGAIAGRIVGSPLLVIRWALSNCSLSATPHSYGVAGSPVVETMSTSGAPLPVSSVRGGPVY